MGAHPWWVVVYGEAHGSCEVVVCTWVCYRQQCVLYCQAHRQDPEVHCCVVHPQPSAHAARIWAQFLEVETIPGRLNLISPRSCAVLPKANGSHQALGGLPVQQKLHIWGRASCLISTLLSHTCEVAESAKHGRKNKCCVDVVVLCIPKWHYSLIPL